MPNVLTRLRINEISCVDRGAGEGVKIMLMKRDEPYWKREFSQQERDAAASSGAAMKDGSYPIKNSSDLHNAMQAVGRAKNPSAVKAHIRRRARALGLTGELSDAFKRENPMGFFQNLFARKAPDIHKSVAALAESVKSINEDGSIDIDKRNELLGQTFDEFQKHIESVAAASAADPGKTGTTEDAMSPDVLKALGLAETADAASVLKAIADLQKAKKKPPFDDKEEEDKEEKDEEKRAAKAKEKDKEKEEEDEKEKEKRALQTMPMHLRKQIEEHQVLKATVAKLQADADLAAMKKIAADALLPDSAVEPLQKLYASGDRKSVDALVGMLKQANSALHASDLLKELGGQGSAIPMTALDELNAKAAELRKREPQLSKPAAFAKVYADPENAALVKRERQENAPRV